MKVGYLVNTYPKPSHSFIRREIRALEARGVAVHRFAMRDARSELVDPADLAEDAATEHVLASGAARLAASALAELARSPRRTLSALRLAARAGWASSHEFLKHGIYLIEACHVARRCRDLGIGHLHAHFGTNSATVAMLAEALGGPSYSFTVHGPEEFDRPDAIALGEKTRRAAFTVAISSFGRSQLCRWVPHADWARIRVVHCGIEPDAFPEPTPVTPGPARFVSIGRFVEQKGQMLLVDAMALALRSDPGLTLTLVGDGELRGALQAAIARHGIGDRVRLTGWLSEAAVRAELQAATAMVLPSFAEGLPVVIMEAMAAGRPVITTAIAGTPELVRAGETGWLVPAGDPEALAEAMLAAAATPADRLSAMGAAGRARVLARHDVHTEAAKLAGHFADALSHRGG